MAGYPDQSPQRVPKKKKTMLLSTGEHFFDPRYRESAEDFVSHLRVWKDEKSQRLFGKIPVIFREVWEACRGMNYKQAHAGGMVVNLEYRY